MDETTDIVKIDKLVDLLLETPLTVIVESDEGGYIARTAGLVLYGYGDNSSEAIANLKIEIESFYKDLMEDNNLSSKYLLEVKAYLKEKIKQ
jgi:hypothetical protein